LDSLGNIEWQKTYGGTEDSIGRTLQQTSDGGFIVAGETKSFGSGGYDFWVLKFNAKGKVQWQKVYGGPDDDRARSVQQTSDGGFVVTGYTYSFGAGKSDILVLKLDSLGNIEWQKTYGGEGDDRAPRIGQTADDGFIVLGFTDSFGAGKTDFWVLKLDSSGNIQWQKTYGTDAAEIGYSIVPASDGGFALTGWTGSWPRSDIVVMKLTESGDVQWKGAYGGGGMDHSFFIEQTRDGSFAVAGATNVFVSADRIPGKFQSDWWIFELAGARNIKWQKNYGGSSPEEAWCVRQTADGGFIAVGDTMSFGAGENDFWVMKLDANGGIGEECSIVEDSFISWNNFVPKISDTAVEGADADVTVKSVRVKGKKSSAIIKEQCFSPSDGKEK